MISEYAPVVAIATARLIAGILFFFQGYDKVFSVGIERIRETMEMGTHAWKLPPGFISFIAFFTSWAELIGGLLLILGLFKYIAIYLLCLNLVIVATGFSMSKPMWETGHVFIRLSLLIFILLFPPSLDIFTIDYLLEILRTH